MEMVQVENRFPGVTRVFNFCAPSHHDCHKVNGRCTMVVTIFKPSLMEQVNEQPHVLPNYQMAETERNDNLSNLGSSARDQYLNEFCQRQRTRKVPKVK